MMAHSCNPSYLRDQKDLGSRSIGAKVHKTPSHAIAGYGGTCLSSQAMQKAEIWRTVVPGQPRQKARSYLKNNQSQKD
jgi:hypothetical protein